MSEPMGVPAEESQAVGPLCVGPGMGPVVARDGDGWWGGVAGSEDAVASVFAGVEQRLGPGGPGGCLALPVRGTPWPALAPTVPRGPAAGLPALR